MLKDKCVLTGFKASLSLLIYLLVDNVASSLLSITICLDILNLKGTHTTLTWDWIEGQASFWILLHCIWEVCICEASVLSVFRELHEQLNYWWVYSTVWILQRKRLTWTLWVLCYLAGLHEQRNNFGVDFNIVLCMGWIGKGEGLGYKMNWISLYMFHHHHQATCPLLWRTVLSWTDVRE